MSKLTSNPASFDSSSPTNGRCYRHHTSKTKIEENRTHHYDCDDDCDNDDYDVPPSKTPLTAMILPMLWLSSHGSATMTRDWTETSISSSSDDEVEDGNYLVDKHQASTRNPKEESSNPFATEGQRMGSSTPKETSSLSPNQFEAPVPPTSHFRRLDDGNSCNKPGNPGEDINTPSERSKDEVEPPKNTNAAPPDGTNSLGSSSSSSSCSSLLYVDQPESKDRYKWAVPTEVILNHPDEWSHCVEVAQSNHDDIEPLVFTIIEDPVEPLLCGEMSAAHFNATCADELVPLTETFLKNVEDIHHDWHVAEENIGSTKDDGMDEHNERRVSKLTCDSITKHPIVCQVQYRFTSTNLEKQWLYPLAYFCSMPSLTAVEAAYHAFPDAIGYAEKETGNTPLHWACHGVGEGGEQHGRIRVQVVQFLLNKLPELARKTNHRDQTALHLLCQSAQRVESSAVSESKLQILNLLLAHYPPAAQMADSSGYTPLHCVCGYSPTKETEEALNASKIATPCNEKDEVLHAWLDALAPRKAFASNTLGALTENLEKPLHVAAASGAPTTILSWILKRNLSQTKSTDVNFQTPLHRAIQKLVESSLLLSTESKANFLMIMDDHDDDGSACEDAALARILREVSNVKLLLKACPKVVSWTDDQDATVLDLAMQGNLPQSILGMLEDMEK